ncbi:MAG: PHP domain-containing protein, partial [Ruminococcus sp.]|nr:PHP domain-containing protein [Ruminococcus sp.]
MITKDLHAHSTYCDGKNTPREMVEAALKKGLNTFGISGHSYTAFDTSYCMQKEDIPRYIEELHYLRAEYFDRIHVLCGVEQ